MDIETATEKQPKKRASGRGGHRPGSGRPKGSLDKGNALIRDMICQALDQVGGVQYLADKAESHPQAFLSLIGKVLPVQLTGGDGGAIAFSGVQVNMTADEFRAVAADLAAVVWHGARRA